MTITIKCPCCDETIRVELTATYPNNNYKSVDIAVEADGE